MPATINLRCECVEGLFPLSCHWKIAFDHTETHCRLITGEGGSIWVRDGGVSTSKSPRALDKGPDAIPVGKCTLSYKG